MNLNREQAECTIQVLKEVMIRNRYADKAIETVFKKSKHLDDQSKALIAEVSYDVIRQFRWLHTLSNSESLWKLLGTWMVINNQPLNSWKEFASISPEKINQRKKEFATNRALRESIPDWLDALGETELGEKWETELKALNEKPGVFIRANTLKTSRADLQVNLVQDGIQTEAVSTSNEALRVIGNHNLFTSQAFQQGFFEVQDAGSQCIAEFLDLKPGMRIVDACCGTGGKTLHLAALVKNKGRLIAMDVVPWKLDELKKRAKRAGVDNLEIKIIESSKTIKRLYETADRLLLDVPCSGLGVLKRNPDAKWRLKEADIQRLLKEQHTILHQYANMTKKGGELVYATCSILPLENEKQVQEFIKAKEGQFELVDEKHLFPSQGFDGFYMARLKRLS